MIPRPGFHENITLRDRFGTATESFDVTPGNDDLPFVTTAIYVGTGGDITVQMAKDAGTRLFKNVPDGSFMPISVRRVLASGTDADDIVALA